MCRIPWYRWFALDRSGENLIKFEALCGQKATSNGEGETTGILIDSSGNATANGVTKVVALCEHKAI